MTGRVEHHSDPFAISIGWLPGRLGAAEFQRAGDRGLDVIDLHLEVHHLRWFPRLLWPGRWLVPGITLDVDVDTAVRVEQLRPPSAGPEVTDLEAKEPLIEARHWSSPLAVNRQPYPPDPHDRSLPQGSESRRGRRRGRSRLAMPRPARTSNHAAEVGERVAGVMAICRARTVPWSDPSPSIWNRPPARGRTAGLSAVTPARMAIVPFPFSSKTVGLLVEAVADGHTETRMKTLFLKAGVDRWEPETYKNKEHLAQQVLHNLRYEVSGKTGAEGALELARLVLASGKPQGLGPRRFLLVRALEKLDLS